ncbi:hypothetical protein D3C71_21280 [compost metagenome]
MLRIYNTRNAKKAARSLEKFLQTLDLGPIKHGQALDALAAMSGFANWAAFGRQMSAEAIDARLGVIEREHIEANKGVTYGAECAVVAHNGFELRYDVGDEFLTYVRICDPLGREIAYWTYEEWAEDPQLVMGGILGALTQGQAVEVGAAPAPAHGDENPEDLPSIADLAPFDSVSHVVIAGAPHFLRYREAEVGALMLQPAGDPDVEDDLEHIVLHVGREVDGFVEERSLTLAALRSLRWSVKDDAFVDEAGTTYEFYEAVRFGARR